MTSSEPSADDVAAGAAIYSARLLRAYDAVVPAYSARVLWRCRTLSRAVNALYNRKRIFANAGDDVDTLRLGLDAHFASYELTVVGAVGAVAAQGQSRTGR